MIIRIGKSPIVIEIILVGLAEAGGGENVVISYRVIRGLYGMSKCGLYVDQAGAVCVYVAQISSHLVLKICTIYYM